MNDQNWFTTGLERRKSQSLFLDIDLLSNDTSSKNKSCRHNGSISFISKTKRRISWFRIWIARRSAIFFVNPSSFNVPHLWPIEIDPWNSILNSAAISLANTSRSLRAKVKTQFRCISRTCSLLGLFWSQWVLHYPNTRRQLRKVVTCTPSMSETW